MSNTRNWGSLHSKFACEFMVQSNHDLYTLEITFCGAQNLFCSHHRIKNRPTLEIGIQCIQNLHVNSWYSQIMTALPQKLLFAVHRNIIRYFHFGPVEKPMNQITAIFVDYDVLYSRLWNKRSPLNKHSPWNIWQKQQTQPLE